MSDSAVTELAISKPASSGAGKVPEKVHGRAPAASANPSAKRLIIVDDHPVFRRGLRSLLLDFPAVTVCGEASTMTEALGAVRALSPDVAVVDVNLPGLNGLELIKSLLAEYPRLLILVVSCYSESTYALRALRAGAKGYVTKSEALEKTVLALQKILEGGLYVSPEFADRLVFKAIQGDSEVGAPVDKLSAREREVLALLGEGKGTRDAATVLRLSVKTVETHRAHIKEKLGFTSGEVLIAFAEEWVEASRTFPALEKATQP